MIDELTQILGQGQVLTDKEDLIPYSFDGTAALKALPRAVVFPRSAAEVAAVRYARLWPRALDLNRPTAADARALALLAREQERIPAARVDFHLAAAGSPPVPGGSPPASDGPL